MAKTDKKHYKKKASRLERDNYIAEDSLIKKGTAMGKQINLYWKRRAEEKKKYLEKFT